MSEGARRGPYPAADLSRLINPRRIAVIGASPKPGSFGARTLENLAGFGGTVIGVNPKYAAVLGRPCVPSLHDLDDSPDAVIVGVPRGAVETALDEAVAVGAGGAIVYASGFAETGIAGRIADQRRLTVLARSSGLPIAGPNCVGLVNVASRAVMNFMTDCGKMVENRTGSIAIVSQSGALGYTVLQAMARGVGFSHYLAAGNSADVDVCDYIAYAAAQDEVRAIVCLLEGVADGTRFLEAAIAAQAAGTALIIYKCGNSQISSQAAMSHTGTLTGSVEAYHAAFEASGAIAVDDLESALEFASLFAKTSPPRHGASVGIMATSGGAGVICADKAELNDLTLPELSPATQAALEQVVPDFGSVSNPADLTAEVLKESATFAHCIRSFAADPHFSAVVVPLVFAHDSATGQRAGVITDVATSTETAVVAVWMNEWLEGPGSAHLDADPHVPLFRSAGRCMAALRAWVRWHEQREQRALRASVAPSRLSRPDAGPRARHLIAAANGALSEHAAKQVLEAYGIRTTRGRIAVTADEAAHAAAEIGFPVAVKIVSADLPHKTDIGGVELNLRGEDDVRLAAERVLCAARSHAPYARIDGVSVEPMVAADLELMIGVKRDNQFGPVLLVGHGGVWVEVLRDVARSLVPISPQRARSLLESLRCYPLLTGHRGGPPLDIDAAVEVICRVSELADDLSDVIKELDVNPVLLGPSGATAADALIHSSLQARELAQHGR